MWKRQSRFCLETVKESNPIIRVAHRQMYDVADIDLQPLHQKEFHRDGLVTKRKLVADKHIHKLTTHADFIKSILPPTLTRLSWGLKNVLCRDTESIRGRE